jgi:hypothetical protein
MPMPTCKCKNTFLPVLHRKNKTFEGLLQNFKNVALFEIVVRTGISLQNISGFYFLVLFLCYAVPSFAVKSYFSSYARTTNQVRLLETPKHGPSFAFMSQTGRNPNWASILLRTLFASCLNWSKTGKNSKNPVKNRYNFFFYFFLKNKFVTLTMHVLRSFCPNGSQKQMHLACVTPNPK